MGVNLRGIANPKSIALEELNGKRLAVDAFNALYQFLSTIRGATGDLLRDNKGRVTSHLSGLFYRNMNLLETGIKLVYVFDGQPPELKRKEIQRRREVKVIAAQKYGEAMQKGDFVAAKKFASATSYLEDEMIQDAKKLLDFMGIAWLQAPSEGEATAAHYTTTSEVDFVASQDYDSLLFGATQLVRNVTISGKRRLPNRNVRIDVVPETVRLSEVLANNEITREQLIDVGILLGTDFNPDGFEGIGPATALKLVKKYSKIEEIPQLKEKTDFDPQDIRNIFLKPEVSSKPLKVESSTPDRNAVIDFLCGEHNFSRERIESSLGKLEERRKRESQSLEQWFA